MLADDLIASRNLTMMGNGRDEFVRDLRRAHRFELDPDFTDAADELGTSRPSAFTSALPMCRPPFDFAWFETAQSSRKRFQMPTPDYAPPIKRIGVLIQGIQGDADLSRWVATLAWSFPNGEVNVCPIAMLYDTGNGPYFPELISDSRRRAEMTARNVARTSRWKDDHNRAAEADMALRSVEVDSYYHAAYLRDYLIRGGREAFDKMARRSSEDWQAEMAFWLGALALLNSRNAAEIGPGRDLTKLNKVKRTKNQVELLSFQTCRIAPKIRARIAAERTHGSQAAQVRAHFVRGHFKIRSSGVFWWSPFLRGDKGAGMVMKDYRVVGRDGAS